MLLQGKKMGFILTTTQLGDRKILQEIERAMMEGAEILIILFDPAGGQEQQERIQGFLELLNYTGNPTKIAQTSNSLLGNENPAVFKSSFFDLLVFFPCSEQTINLLTKIAACDESPALVLAPDLGKKQLPLHLISSLTAKKKIFFVPFGPVDKKEDVKETPAIYSRLDLLLETCIAALEGYQPQPYIWENNLFPR